MPTVVIGAGLAGLSVVDTLLQNGIDPQDVILIHEGVNPWDRDDIYGFGGNTWTSEFSLTKKLQLLPELQSYLTPQEIDAKILQATDFIIKYTNGRAVEHEDRIELDSEAVNYFITKIWADFRNKQVRIEDRAVCRQITNVGDYIIYDKGGEDLKQEQRFTNLILATGKDGYNVAHSLGEYAAGLADAPLKIITPSGLQVNKNCSLCNMEKVYTIGGLLGYSNPMVSIIQGVIAGESIAKSI